MQDWHHRRTVDLGLRLGGATLCGLAALAIRTLLHLRMPPPPASPGLIALALAVAGFVCASLGAALAAIGRHVFDPVEIGARWRRCADVARPIAAPTPATILPRSAKL